MHSGKLDEGTGVPLDYDYKMGSHGRFENFESAHHLRISKLRRSLG